MVAHGVMGSAVRRLLAFMVSFLVVMGTFVPVAVAASGANGRGSFTVGVKRREMAEGSTGLSVGLLYGDKKGTDGHPDGVAYSTGGDIPGYIALSPDNLTEDLEDVYVTLRVPKEYVRPGSLSIPEFSTASSVTRYELVPATEDGDDYVAGIHFLAYDKTQTMYVLFSLGFVGGLVPADYRLPVSVSVSCGDTVDTSASPLTYMPKYEPYGIEKFVNSNKRDVFGKDGAEVVVVEKDEGGNPYLEDREVKFSFMVNGCPRRYSNPVDLRELSSITLTDELPRYVDEDGASRIASFDPSANAGWTLSEDGTSVSKTYSGDSSKTIMMAIYEDEPLVLRFPGLPFSEDKDGILSAELDNTVRFVAEPKDASDGEPRPEGSDSLRFRITTNPETHGRLSKTAEKRDIYDTDAYKTNPYPWRIRVGNDGAQPLEHIVLADRKIEGNGGCDGLDGALRFTGIRSDLGDSVLPDGTVPADIVDRVVAYWDDGSSGEVPMERSENGDFEITFDDGRDCVGFEVAFDDGFALPADCAVSFVAYTVYRDPDGTVVPDGEDRVRYTNQARVVSWYKLGDKTMFPFLWSMDGYDMLPVRETLGCYKTTYFNNGSAGNEYTKPGSVFFYYLKLTGDLLDPEEKTYEDLRIIDLLPEGIECVADNPVWNKGTLFKDYASEAELAKSVEIIDNYHNSGRTAVIIPFTYEQWKHAYDTSNKNVHVMIRTRIAPDARTGVVTNDVYVVGKNLDDYYGSTGWEYDVYDLDGDGRTDDRIAHGSSQAWITASASLYAEKSVSPAGAGRWSKQGLSVSTGTDFDYRLRVVNELEDRKDLVVHDVLPAPGDSGIFGGGRGSEFSVRLRGPVRVPDGYDVWYTDDPDARAAAWDGSRPDGGWSVDGWESATAFRIVAREGTVLAGGSTFDAVVPVRVQDALDPGTEALLDGKGWTDGPSGISAALEAVNAFGFRTDGSPVAESNEVAVRMAFVGFVVRKADGSTGSALAGATFELSDDGGGSKRVAVSDGDGMASFRCLPIGTYFMREVGAPAGYVPSDEAVRVDVALDPVTMEWKVSFDGSGAAGTHVDPLVVENSPSGYEFPDTGGTGTGAYMVCGSVLALPAGFVLFRRRKRD